MSGGTESDQGDEIAPPPDLDGVAIIGMAGRFPGAPTVAAFWQNLRDAADAVTWFSDADLEDAYTAEERARPDFVAARSVLDDVDRFDATLFRMRAREAALTDPQHRVFLEVAWEVLEDAGYDPKACAGRSVGVYAGCSLNTYLLRHVCGDRAAVERFTDDFQVGSYEALVGSIADALATRVSYKLDLRGPSLSVATACSTSLTAVAQAVQALLLHQCDMAIAGGVSITFPQRRGAFVQDGGMVSTDGVCRPFDAGANGTVFGSGAGAVLLKRVEDAVTDGDHVYAVIKGAAINNDGASKVGFTAPSVDAQAEVVATAQAIAGFDPATIQYVECHGTATPLGDPIEVAALAKAFGPAGGPGRCLIGSVKGNVGHLDAAAGVTGLIKAALAIDRGLIPATRNFRSPNPRLNLDGTPFQVVDRLTPWPESGGPRRAGVSALGVGGTNVHLCLEQAPSAPVANPLSRDRTVLLLSARSPEGLAQARAALARRLRADPGIDLADVAHTLAVGRGAYDHRCAVTADGRDQAIARLEGGPGDGVASGEAAVNGRPVLFLFPGQGAQHPAMGLDLYRTESVFAAAVDRCAAILLPFLGLDLRVPLYGRAAVDGEGAEAIRRTVLAQPAIFTVEYALAQLWLSRGVRPAAMIGHSVGEFVAATIANVFSLADALSIVAERGRLMQSVPAGAMLAVRMAEADLRALLPPGVDLAASNGPALSVASGPFDAVENLERGLSARDVQHKRLHTSHAFHSAMMDPILGPLATAVGRVDLRRAEIPYVSCVTGTWVTDGDTRAADYWTRHCRSTVRFRDGLATLLDRFDAPVLLEVGPGATLVTLSRQAGERGKRATPVTSTGGPTGGENDADAFADAYGRLWTAGAAFDRGVAFPGRRISLPATPFERQSYWIPAPRTSATTAGPARAIAEVPVRPEALPPSPETDHMSARTAPTCNGHDKTELAGRVAALLETMSGERVAATDHATPFLELGFDSLFLAQVATQVQRTFGVKVTFRQLVDTMSSVVDLTDHLASVIPPPTVDVAATVAMDASLRATVAPQPAAASQPSPAASSISSAPFASAGIEALFREQLSAMQSLVTQQNQILLGQAATVAAPRVAGSPVGPPSPAAAPVPRIADAADQAPSRHQLYRPGGGAAASEMTDRQRTYLADLISRYETRTAGSKRLTDRRRAVLADPRSAAGFRPEWKEMVYPIVCARSKGSKIWDVDGNEYVDLVNGYGQTAFGHAPDFVLDAVSAQMRDGFAIGPQSPLAGEVAELFAAMTGNERVTFCNTGSEAVMAAMRVARAVTGRDRVVVFGGDYHGQFDEVLVKGKARQDADPRGLPIAPGIPYESVANMVVLPYGTPESLDWVRRNGADVAAVVVETVQSRHPALQPKAFLQDLRAITEQCGSAYVFDEVVTGFRVHPGGMQAYFGIQADMATYGKVVGGGMPIGVLAGKRAFMDALDGGAWRYGDGSVPQVAPTFFAGTFVRHPLVLAAVKAVLLHLKAEGPALQERLTARTAALVDRMNADLSRRGVASRAETFSSWFYFNPVVEDRLAGLIYHEMRSRGVHIQEGFPCFLTTAHDDADFETVLKVFTDSLDALQGAGILPGTATAAAAPAVADEVLPDRVPWTEPQKEVWLSAQLGDAASCAFNESVTLTFEGELDEGALTGALDDVVARHDSLRARFDPDEEAMHVLPVATMPLRRVDLRAEAEADRALQALLDEDARTPFDLAQGPVARAILVAVRPDRHALVLTAHHIVCDGWSINVLIGEVSARYAARLGHAADDLAAAPSFRRYALDQRQPRDTREAATAFWRQAYEILPHALDLPADRPRPAQKSYRGATHHDVIDAALVRAAKAAGARHRCTLFVTLLAALQVVVARLSGEDDVVVAIPTAGQSAAGLPGLVGHCVNLLPLRVTIDREATLADRLRATRTILLDAFDHQDLTFGTLVRDLRVPRTQNRLPLTQIQFNLEKLSSGPSLPGVTLTTTSNGKAFSNFDLFVNCTESADGIRVDCDYNSDLFDPSTIRRLIAHVRVVLGAMVEDDARPVGRAALLPPEDVLWMAGTLNETDAEGLDLRPVHVLIAEQARRTPDATALVWREASLTYAELDAAANRLARHVSDRVPTPGSRVAIATSRSPAMVVAMLGVMKAGHAYVPLDTAQPIARQRLILEDAKVAAIVVDEAGAAADYPDLASIDTVRQAPVIRSLSAESPAGVERQASESTAYVIFTSGSTGRPKGVAITHRSLANLLWSMASRPGFTSADTLLAVTTIGFDIAGAELLLPLLNGGRVVIADREEVVDGFALVARLASSRATVVQATPSLWRLLLEAGFASRSGLTMIAGGEVLPRDLADRLLAGGGALWNAYGPTETTIWSSLEEVRADGAPITIGRPVFNTRFHVLDAGLQLTPVGVEGELFIGGAGLATGYFGRPDLTAAAFARVDVPGVGPDLLYRTGDRARRLADGAIQLLGRNDGQVKLRGFRIELEEIETALRRCPGVSAAAVALHGSDGADPRLVGYVVATVPTAVVASFAAEHLPRYMVPTAWTRLDALPLTPNGKLDRRALAALAVPDAAPLAITTAPQTPLQKTLAGIVCEVLHLQGIDVNDNLFALGLDSIQVFRIAARMRAEGVSLHAADLMQHPTILALEEAVGASARDVAPSGVPDLRSFRRKPAPVRETTPWE